MEGNWRKVAGSLIKFHLETDWFLTKIYVITGKTECEEVMLSCWRAH